MDIACLNFNKAFNTTSYRILLDKMQFNKAWFSVGGVVPWGDLGGANQLARFEGPISWLGLKGQSAG